VYILLINTGEVPASLATRGGVGWHSPYSWPDRKHPTGWHENAEPW